MAMSLSDIEERAQDLIAQLLNAGKNEALLLGIQIEGLRDLAQIKAVGMEAQAWGTTEPDPRNVSGLCFAISPLAIGKPPYPCCDLMRGHAGEHSDDNTNWTNAAEKPEQVAPVVPPPCPSSLRLSKDEYYVCVLPFDHDSQHRGGGKWWDGPGNGEQEAEPTKPAADRLHELLSYVTDQQVQATALIDNDVRPTVRDQAAARRHAYHDVALKLEDILSEGGI